MTTPRLAMTRMLVVVGVVLLAFLYQPPAYLSETQGLPHALNRSKSDSWSLFKIV